MDSRSQIRDIILDVERNCNVNNWKVNDIHLWPYIRIHLFFNLIDEIEIGKTTSSDIPGNKKNSTYIYRGFKKKIRKTLECINSVFFFFSWIKNIPKRQTVFVSSNSFRVNYRNKRFNRFFDVLVEDEQVYSNYMYLEYGSTLTDQYKHENVFKFGFALKGFLCTHIRKKTKLSLDGYDYFLSYLERYEHCKKFSNKFSKAYISQWAKTIFIPKVVFFKKILRRISPKELIILCYYTEDIYPLVTAANNLGISTIEMQHGPQNKYHLGYGSWYAIPKTGYDILPRIYWCWDDFSANEIKEWADSNSIYSVEKYGNPWVDYWNKKSKSYINKDFILYTLQPLPIPLDVLLHDKILNIIKTSKKKWFIRLHPRQWDDKEKIKAILEKHLPLDTVNIDVDNATVDPLPLLLANCSLHITYSSGSALEASYFGVKTIFIDKMGLSYYPHLFTNKLAFLADFNSDDFETTLGNYIKAID